MSALENHLRRYRSPRPSTLAYLELRDERTEQLRREIAAAKRDRSRLSPIFKRAVLWASWIWRV